MSPNLHIVTPYFCHWPPDCCVYSWWCLNSININRSDSSALLRLTSHKAANDRLNNILINCWLNPVTSCRVGGELDLKWPFTFHPDLKTPSIICWPQCELLFLVSSSWGLSEGPYGIISGSWGGSRCTRGTPVLPGFKSFLRGFCCWVCSYECLRFSEFQVGPRGAWWVSEGIPALKRIPGGSVTQNNLQAWLWTIFTCFRKPVFNPN